MLDKEKLLSERLNQHTFNKRIDKDSIFITVLSDIHYGANDKQYFEDTIKFISDIGAYVIIGGDTTNSVTANSVGKLQDEWLQNKDDQITELADKLKPLAESGHILAIGENGNHNSRLEDSVYISPNKMLSVLLGDRSLYTGDMCLGFINVKDICYTISVMHKTKKTKNYYEFQRADIVFHEHLHEMHYEQKPVYEFNKYSKSVSAVPTLDIWNGSFINLPNYSMKANYRPQYMGTYFVRLDGNKRDMTIFEDDKLYNIIKCGYKG